MQNNLTNRLTSRDDRIFGLILNVVMTACALLVLYPLIFIVSASFSSPAAVSTGKVILWPVDFSLEGYRAVFKDPNILTGYRNTLLYTGAGTLINVTLTFITAYALARPSLPLKGLIMFLFTFTMLFNGGMMPTYVLMRNLKLVNKVWAMLLPGAIAAYNMIITRTFLQSSIPHELLEASQIDGCSDFRYLGYVVLPLSKAVLAVITLYYAVGHWNAYFDAFLYLSRRELFPLQIILRDILIANTIDPAALVDPDLMTIKQGMADLLKYSLIVVSSAPILCLYPLVQRYFIQGVMIGSIKG
ncbi:MAG TPA: carbohydrate ABC transporter permease [Clostridia bacterium]|nr:carbohydrate ABC transporter permease [Clostridia bacterium]